jgi:hypothetical protein
MTEDHVVRNRAAWDRFAEEFVEPGRRSWASDEPTWGTWGVPEVKVGMLIDVAGLDTIELGCGTGYVSARLARRGTRKGMRMPISRRCCCLAAGVTKRSPRSR